MNKKERRAHKGDRRRERASDSGKQRREREKERWGGATLFYLTRMDEVVLQVRPPGVEIYRHAHTHAHTHTRPFQKCTQFTHMDARRQNYKNEHFRLSVTL